MKHYIAGALALGAIALIPIQQAIAYNALHSKAGAELRWQQQVIPFYINTSGFTDFDAQQLEQATRECIRTWQTVNFGLQFDFRGATDVKEAEDDNINVIYFEQNSNTWDKMFPDATAALAMTRVWSDEHGEILGFDMVFNDGKYTFTNTLDPALAVYDYINTCTHEFGHAIGLDHSQVPEATMAATAAKGDISKRDLDTDDIQGIQYLYRSGFQEDSELFGCSTVAMNRSQEANSEGGSSALTTEQVKARGAPKYFPLWAMTAAVPLLYAFVRRRRR